MNRTVKWFLISLCIALLLGFVGLRLLKADTKRHSPEQDHVFVHGDLEINVFYCSPSKRGRQIFGGLVPFGEVWRTGANEASTFMTNKDLHFGDQTLKAGSYSLFSIPDRDEWQLIFNKGRYEWGLNWDETSPRDQNEGEVIIRGKSTELTAPEENFTISVQVIEKPSLQLSWDNTLVEFPFTH